MHKPKYQLPPKISLHPKDDDFINTMPCLLPHEANRYGVKIVSRVKGRTSALKSDSMLYDVTTGELLAVIDCDYITTMRTGAVAALAVDTLKKSYVKKIALMGLGIAHEIAIMCKVCVAIFVFVSGYGLTEKYGDGANIKLKDFYWKRFTKLMLNYWFVWLIFIPISVLWLVPSFAESYGSDKFLQGRVVLDSLEIVNWLGPTVYNYNGAWWFYGCIIGLYLLYPILLRMARQNENYLIVFSV